jgi:tetratricopeptide (TPR) repeat protein
MEQSSRGYRSLEQGELARRHGQPEQARRAFGEALFFFRNDADLAGEALALHRQADVAWELGEMDWALHEQAEAIALFRRAGDGLGLARALRCAADLCLAQQRMANAVAYLAEAMDLYRVHPDVEPRDWADALCSVARLAEALGEPVQARHYWQDAEAHYAGIGLTLLREEDGIRIRARH